jgi:hypothetical protein
MQRPWRHNHHQDPSTGGKQPKKNQKYTSSLPVPIPDGKATLFDAAADSGDDDGYEK